MAVGTNRIETNTVRVHETNGESGSGPHDDFDTAQLDAAQPVPVGPDPFDPERLRLSGDMMQGIEVKRTQTVILPRKPHKSEFVRANPDPNYRLHTATLEIASDRGKEVFILDRSLWAALATDPTFKLKLFVTAITRQGNLFLWEANIPRSDGGNGESWAKSALDAITSATKRWVKVVANMGAGGYDLYEAMGDLDEPNWPDTPFRDILSIAFRDRMLTDINHPVLRRLRGEI